MDVGAGETGLMEASVVPFSANPSIRESSDPSVAMVEGVKEGAKVKGIKPGQAVIQAVSIDGRIHASFHVFVFDNKKEE
ncbi:Ig-like domain-containing protein [Paenibacillus hexagrammi]|uniref:Uncharacterized protein n=1 Tax=Paenibacillus hexagrammi TaxID=2908839 RepID=A0ABY3SR39_9BACL|nr:hypothetical protein [Paenibacillus sp. YPD9-1]UJF36532.1 hypothetical protein L0M14_14185 [Paenibacillus sp. YPD9-1]